MPEICRYCSYCGRDGICKYFGNTNEAWRLGWVLQMEVKRELNGDCWRFEVKDSVKRRGLTLEELRRLPLGILAKINKRRS